MRCDLHMHSRCSDGTLEVEALVEAVHAAGVEVFALTDHDTLEGLERAEAVARRLGLRLVPGVEISSRLGDLELHILGYGFDPAHPGLARALAGQQAARRGRIPQIVEKLQGMGLAIEVEDVFREAGSATPGRPHVARALVTRGHVRDSDEAFRRFLGDGGPAQIRKNVPAPSSAIAWIHEAGGKAVWAHPLARPLQRPGGFDLLLRELATAGLDGIEEVHPSQDERARRRIRRAARELGLRVTGGSDFHGAATPGISIGSGRGRDHVPASVLEALLSAPPASS
jgi:predicted metal-dependent phosphoesterase TrpH